MSNFPDGDLIVHTRRFYGHAMADRLAEILKLDPENESGFANSIRRSLTREISAHAERALPPPAVEETT